MADPRLRKPLRGELDNIVLKAMAKRPADRYTSIEQFAYDIQRHRTGRTVLAQGHAFPYRVRKFIRRNWTLVATTTMLSFALLAGVVSTLHQAGIANHQRALAERRYNDVRALATTMLFGIHDRFVISLAQPRREGSHSKRALNTLKCWQKTPRGTPLWNRS